MYVLAMDGGGTKTSAVICDEVGHVYAKVNTTRSNPTAMDIPYFEATLHALLQNLLQQNPQAFVAIESCFAGMAGVKELHAESTVEHIIRQYVQKKVPVLVENDALIALYAGTLGKPGIIQIAGTGAITMGYDQEKKFHRVGGWGYLFDDAGSGYDLGVQALKAVFQNYDGRKPATQLTEAVLRHFAKDTVPQLISSIYNDEHPRTNIAPLSKYVIEAVEQGDAIALRIIEEACQSYYEAIKTCYAQMTWEDEQVPVILTGGVFSNEQHFIPTLQQLAEDDGLPLHFMKALVEPIGGAVVGAFQQISVEIGQQFVDTFNKR
ncbi:N-acetylglucosamine kinase [Lysinibacillus piscis]|uniref:N-acetylglucosamine kinase n=1 Tax=Lysinibacillus piscis TaxID=2518931 RepID=A0ABQ5NJP3_9BACI|nr:BadF/BadG/BcrA/BcrD ATPase family protein [Lysinibacillus sp. KH24]GLC88490.1 N-acetylglucosamine kinase [Lysinibacillus sp. KH24]